MESNTNKTAQVQLILIIVSLLVSAVSIIISIYISRGISKPANIIAQAAAEIADGNLSLDDVTVKSSDEIGQLGYSFNKMKINLRDLLQKSFCFSPASSSFFSATYRQRRSFI